MRMAAPASTGRSGICPAATMPTDGQAARRVLGRAGDVCALEGVAVHAGVGEGRQGQRRGDVLGQGLAHGFQQRNLDPFEGGEAGHHALVGFLHAEHILPGVAVAVVVGRFFVVAVVVTAVS